VAGDWIKLQHVTPDKPEVYQIAGQLKITAEQVIGHLVRVWIWVDQQSRDGHALSVTNVTLDAIARRGGFASAMHEVGWLTGVSGNLSFPNFERHNGQSAKKRALAGMRQARHRNSNRHAVGVTEASPEKRREEVKKQPSGCTVDFWKDGIELLVDQGLTQERARSLIGRWAGRDEAQLKGVLAGIRASPPADAVAYIEKAMQKRVAL
jgi:hypothetical protein